MIVIRAFMLTSVARGNDPQPIFFRFFSIAKNRRLLIAPEFDGIEQSMT